MVIHQPGCDTTAHLWRRFLAGSVKLSRYLGLSANCKFVIVAIIDGQGQDAQTMSALDQYCLSVFLLDSSS